MFHLDCVINNAVFLAILIDCQFVSQGLLALGDFFHVLNPKSETMFVSISEIEFVSIDKLQTKSVPM